MGHGTGAALVNFIAVSPVAKELLHRVILLSGSGLSPWALQRDPLWVKRIVAKHTGCHGDLYEDDLAPCLRLKPLNFLLNVKVDTPRFLPGFAPFIDGTILVNPTSHSPTTSTSTVATAPGYELADFPERDLLFSLTNTESYLDLNAQDLEFGFNETKRDRILRTYVRNSYYFHLNEIFSTLKNEYTDWERPSQNPLSVRDAALDVLSDGHTVSPLIRIGYLHSTGRAKTFFLHFQHHTGERDLPLRLGSVRGEDLPYILGLPLIGGGPFFPHNYSFPDVAASRTLIQYISNFITSGNQLPILLEDVPLQGRISMWLLQDGAPPHYGAAVVIGRGGFVEWAPRSPDLNPMDFFCGKNISIKSQFTVKNTPLEREEKICLGSIISDTSGL
ncbi:neuroligin-1-like [Dendroctonus ponderosae]|uniref:neuroligin-1-like n=1 Tax=Dendroctonus ponderosae TaxID=77166 RepID=UPI002035723A|nr:neuroligin-1-like [Dendroctonus ponderosae]